MAGRLLMGTRESIGGAGSAGKLSTLSSLDCALHAAHCSFTCPSMLRFETCATGRTPASKPQTPSPPTTGKPLRFSRPSG
ncbi:hypothetical protein CLOM_g12428 [Closterium sp. NIES-68]|nr:hypothetical protein CLOM_g12428 [Closterium sp. NIES-68]